MISLRQLYSECSRKRDYVHTMFIGFGSNGHFLATTDVSIIGICQIATQKR
jgi:hypothetical protein